MDMMSATAGGRLSMLPPIAGDSSSSTVDYDAEQAMLLTSEIDECRRQLKFWTEKKEKLEAQQRQRFLFERLRANGPTTWARIPENKRTKELVLAALSCNPFIFGDSPWYNWEHHQETILPLEYMSDRDVLLAFAKANDDWEYEIPEFARDDKEIVLTLCSKHFENLQDASPRLRDDEEVVLAAICNGLFTDGDQSTDMLQYASERLRRDPKVLLAAVQATKYPDFDWLQYARFPNVQTERDIALAVLERLSSFDNEDMDCCEALQYFSNAVVDDKELTMQFVSTAGYCFKWCSERLRADEEIVKVVVNSDPSVALEFSLGDIREELASDYSFVSLALKDTCRGEVFLHASAELQQDKTLVLLVVGSELQYSAISHAHQADPDVALKKLESCKKWNEWGIPNQELPDFDVSLTRNKSFALAAVQVNCDFFLQLQELQSDEEIALQTVKSADSGCLEAETARVLLERHPWLKTSREAMRALLPTHRLSSLPPSIFCVDDKELLLQAVQKNPDAFRCASARLRSDRDVALSALAAYHQRGWDFPLDLTSEEFKLNNVDVVVQVIDSWPRYSGYIDDRASALPVGLLEHRSVIVACLRKGCYILYRLPKNSAFRDDPDIIKLSVQNTRRGLWKASQTLRSDREFIRSLVTIDARVLDEADDTAKYDYDILVAAIANSDETVVNCFSDNDYDFLVSFAALVRKKLQMHSIFLREILCGISVAPDRCQSMALAEQCSLPLLEQGPETCHAHKRKIAEFLGVPIGEALRFHRAASTGLAKYGF